MSRGCPLAAREMDGLTRWPGVWTPENSLRHVGQGLPQCSRANLIQSSYPRPHPLLPFTDSPCLSYLGESRSQTPVPPSCCPASTSCRGPQGAPTVTLLAPTGCSLGKCGLPGCPPTPTTPVPLATQAHAGTLCSPRQSSMAVSWWRPDSDEFSRSWIPSRSF